MKIELQINWIRRAAEEALEDDRPLAAAKYEEIAESLRTQCTEDSHKFLAMELAWGVIANAYGGDWGKASADWREAAERWRDEHWHPALDRASAQKGPSVVIVDEPVSGMLGPK